MDAVGAVGSARPDLVQKDDIAVLLLDPHRVAGERRELGGERGQLMVMRRQKGAAAVDLVQMLERRPRGREASQSNRSSPGPAALPSWHQDRGVSCASWSARPAARISLPIPCHGVWQGIWRAKTSLLRRTEIGRP